VGGEGSKAKTHHEGQEPWFQVRLNLAPVFCVPSFCKCTKHWGHRGTQADRVLPSCNFYSNLLCSLGLSFPIRNIGLDLGFPDCAMGTRVCMMIKAPNAIGPQGGVGILFPVLWLNGGTEGSPPLLTSGHLSTKGS
jgi:hypothetical protein